MNASATLQRNIQIRRSRFAGVVLAVAGLSAVTAWSITNAASESRNSSPNVVAESNAATPDGRAAQLDGTTVDSQQQRRLDAEVKLDIDLDDFDKAEQDFLIGLAESGGVFVPAP
jgi:hypothetical protein